METYGWWCSIQPARGFVSTIYTVASSEGRQLSIGSYSDVAGVRNMKIYDWAFVVVGPTASLECLPQHAPWWSPSLGDDDSDREVWIPTEQGETDIERQLDVASAVSRQISKLEGQIGVPLLERRQRSVVASPAGERLAEHARRSQLDAEEILSEIQGMSGLRTGLVRIACVEGTWQRSARKGSMYAEGTRSIATI